MNLLITVIAVVRVPLFNTKAVGAAGATAVSVSNLAVELVVGFKAVALAVTDDPTPFTDFTPSRNTLVKVVSTVALVSVLPSVTPAKFTKMNGSVLAKSVVIEPPSRAVILFTPVGNSQR
jgi:hypothetical protein